MHDATTTLIAKLAMAMPGYLDDLSIDPLCPYLIVQADVCGSSVIRLTSEENAILQAAIQCKEVGDDSVLHFRNNS